MLSKRSVGQDASEYRVVIFGNADVGKTSLVTRFIKGTFKESYSATIEDTHRQVITCNNSVCALHITDTGGSHSFPAMERLAIQRGQAFILVYSVCDRKSFENLENFYNNIASNKSTLDQVPVMVVGNKCDVSNRSVNEEEGMKLARQWKCSYIETSAKQSYNTREVFEQLLLQETRQAMSLDTENKKKKKHSKSSKRAGNIKNRCVIT